jgi:ribose transport system substrate-binding protein
MSGRKIIRQNWLRKSLKAVTATVAVFALAACSSSGSGEAQPTAGAGEVKRIAFLASSSQNGYNQAVWEGIQAQAKTLGNVEVEIFDGQFAADVQLNQLEDAATSGKFDGIIVVPNDTVGIAAGVATAKANDVPVVTVLFPIGPELKQLEPQVDGIISTIASPPADGATKQAELVVEHCATLEGTCKVVILIGQLQYPFDNVRYEAYLEVLEAVDTIEIVATASGNYDRDTSLTAMTDVLQANKDIDVVLSNADQQTLGAEIALKEAGYEPGSVYLTGGGGTFEAVAAVRAGTWAAAYLNFPVSMGEAAVTQLVNFLTGEAVQSVVDADTIGPIKPFVTKEDLDANPDFMGTWSG